MTDHPEDREEEIVELTKALVQDTERFQELFMNASRIKGYVLILDYELEDADGVQAFIRSKDQLRTVGLLEYMKTRALNSYVDGGLDPEDYDEQ